MDIRLLFIGFLLIALPACYDDVRVTLKEAHRYQGKADPHTMDASARADKLAARFQAVQLDR
ncbi:MAG: hypothetical protein ACU843_04325 [Gammaproteobacteria bacterium]